MKNYRLAIVVIGLVLTLGGAPSWGQDPSSNDTSDGKDNTGGGRGALVSTTTGASNTAYGTNALSPNTVGSENTATGAGALANNTGGSENTATGAGALANNAIGNNNTATGVQALFHNNAIDNTAFGFNALFSNTTGTFNTAVGFGALSNNTFGGSNTAIGLSALAHNNGDQNTALGSATLYFNSTGSNNTAIGLDALLRNTTGAVNTAIGNDALENNTFGASNTAIGVKALFHVNNGGSNTAIGAGAGFNLTSGNNNIYLGSFGGTSESNTMRLGHSQARTFISGIAGVPVTGKQVFINSNGQLGILASSARFKRDIQTMGNRSRRLLQLRPVTFRYKQDPQGQRQYGLIAEEVAKVYPDLVTKGADGKVDSVQYHELIPMLLNEVQHQQHALEAQAQQLAHMKAQNQRLQAELVEQNAALAGRLQQLETQAGRTVAKR